MDAIPREIKQAIVLYTSDGATWKSIRATSKEFRGVCAKYDAEMVRKFSDHLLTLVMKFPNEHWNWEELSSRLPWDYILNHTKNPRDYILAHANPYLYNWAMTIEPWNWNELCARTDIPVEALSVFGEQIRQSLSRCAPWEYIKANPSAEWSWEGISKFGKISWDIVRSHPIIKWEGKHLSSNGHIGWDDEFLFPWCNTDWCELSQNLSIKAADVIARPNAPWDWYELSYNPDMLDIIPLFPDKEWDWAELSEHKGAFEMALENPNLPWDWYQLAGRVDIKTILAHPEMEWEYDGLSWNPSVTWEYIISRPDIKWSRRALSSNRNIPVRTILENLHIGDGHWDLAELTYRATMAEIKEFPKMSWVWQAKSITASWEDIAGNPDAPWDWSIISSNPHMTWDIIASNLNKGWNWYIISRNNFDGWKKDKYQCYWDYTKGITWTV